MAREGRIRDRELGAREQRDLVRGERLTEHPDLRYRTRVVIRFLGEDWKQASIRAEANWQKGEEWEIGYDGKILDDVAAELKAKIGKR